MEIKKEQIERALKDVYLNVIINQLNEDIDPILNKIKREDVNVYGKAIVVNYYKENLDEYELDKCETFELADFMIEFTFPKTKNMNSISFVNLLNHEIEEKLREYKQKIRNAFYNEDIKPKDWDKRKPYKYLNINGLKNLFARDDNFKPTLITTSKEELNKTIETELFKRKFDIVMGNEKLVNNWLNSLKTDENELYNKNNGEYYIFHNLIIYPNDKITKKEIYLLNTDDFRLEELTDWRFLNWEAESILREVGNWYKFCVVKYANYICKNPERQIKIKLGDK